jgi:hypothetical protein
VKTNYNIANFPHDTVLKLPQFTVVKNAYLPAYLQLSGDSECVFYAGTVGFSFDNNAKRIYTT